jgi:hypothetical protein
LEDCRGLVLNRLFVRVDLEALASEAKPNPHFSLIKEAAKIATLQYCASHPRQYKTFFQLENVEVVRGLPQFWWYDAAFMASVTQSKCYSFLKKFVQECRRYAERLPKTCESLHGLWTGSIPYLSGVRHLRPLWHGNDKSSLRRELLKVKTCLTLSPAEDKRQKLEKRKSQLESVLG